MNILHVEMGRQLYGGAKQVLYLINGLNQRGITSGLIAPKNSAVAEEVSALGNPVFEIDYKGDLDFRLATHVQRAAKAFEANIVHVHSRRGADVWAAIGARRAHCKSILSRRVDNPETPQSIRRKYARFAHVITISEGIQRVLISNGLDASRISCVRSAIISSEYQSPVSRTEFCSRFGIPETSLIIGVVAQLIPRKGHTLLLTCLPDLIKKHNQTQVLFFGQGKEASALEERIHSLGLQERVSLVGFHADLNRLIGNLDILVHPALQEGLGVSLIQAAAASVPIIASDAGGMPEVVRHQKNGLLIPPGDVTALADAIDQLALSARLRQQLGAAGKNIADQEFSVDTMVEGNLDVYRRTLGQTHAFSS